MRMNSLFARRAPAPKTLFRFPVARHGRGELFYHEDIPILKVEGTAEEVGTQLAHLTVWPASRLLDYPEDLLSRQFHSRLLARLLVRKATRVSSRLLAQFPEGPRQELEAMIATGLNRDKVILGNTLYDLKNISLPQFFGCSSLVVPASRSVTGGPLFGRNLDFYGLGYLHEYSLVTVRLRSSQTLAYATIGFPGTLGCFSGMNEVGLALASHEVFNPPGPHRYNPRGIPFTLAYRRVLEECRYTHEVADMLRSMERTTSTMLMLCDPDGGRLLEVMPNHVLEFPCETDTLTCTNHYRTPELACQQTPKQFRTSERLLTLNGLATAGGTFGLAEMASALNAVHQGDLTLQSMIFEPAAATIHVSFGPGPTTDRSPVRLELSELFH